MQLTAIARLEHPRLEVHETNTHEPTATASRPIAWPGTGTVATPIHRAPDLEPGAVVAGPAILEADDTTYVVPAGWSHRIDSHGIGWTTRNPNEEQ